MVDGPRFIWDHLEPQIAQVQAQRQFCREEYDKRVDVFGLLYQVCRSISDRANDAGGSERQFRGELVVQPGLLSRRESVMRMI